MWFFEEPPRRLSQIERRSCQFLRELEHWLFLPTVSMSRLSKKGARSRALTVIYDLLLARSAGGLYPEEPAMSGRTEGAIDIPVGGASSDASSPPPFPDQHGFMWCQTHRQDMLNSNLVYLGQ